jgi:oligopeptide transport system substrate-binding protein
MQHRSLTVRRAVLITLISISLLAGPTVPVLAGPLRQDNDPVTLRLAVPPIDSIDPVQLSRFTPHTHDLVENLFVGLTRYDPLTHTIEPMIAKSWSVSEDGLTWTFELRDDIWWVRTNPDSGDITPVREVVAGDFTYAIKRACDPLRPSPVTANLMLVRGCQTVANAFPEVISDLFIAQEIGVRTVGPYTLEIDLMFPAAYFLTLTSTPEFRPLARETVSMGEDWTSPDAIMTNGPFALTVRSSTGLTLQRNPHWPEPFAGNIDQIDVQFTDDVATASTMIAAERVDLARLKTEEIADARSRTPDLLRTAPGNSITFLGTSYDRALVDQPAVRRALGLAINRSALTGQLLADQAVAADQFTPPGMAAGPEFNGLAINHTQAQAALSSAGYDECSNIPETLITLVPNDSPVWVELGQAIIQQWSDQLGCSPQLFEVRELSRILMIEISHATYDTEAVTRSHLWLATWIADYPDANAWLNDALHCRYGYIRTGRECGTADDLLDQAAVEMDPVQRAALYAQVEEIFFGPNGSFPVIPLYISITAWLQQPWLTGVNEAGAARFDLWTINPDLQPGA